jgi:hypothetical protein
MNPSFQYERLRWLELFKRVEERITRSRVGEWFRFGDANGAERRRRIPVAVSLPTFAVNRCDREFGERLARSRRLSRDNGRVE